MKKIYIISLLISMIGIASTQADKRIGKSIFCELLDRPQLSDTRKFVFNSDIKLFQFKGEHLAIWQKDINAQLMKIKDKWVADFDDDLKFYFYDFEDFKEYLCELEIESDVLLNTPKIFSCITLIHAYHHGANGCQSHVEALNFFIENGKAKPLDITDIVKESLISELLSLAVSKIAEQDKIGYLKNSFTESYFIADAKEKDSIRSRVQFALTHDSIVIIFPAYTIAAGCEGILFCELKYKDISVLLKMESHTL